MGDHDPKGKVVSYAVQKALVMNDQPKPFFFYGYEPEEIVRELAKLGLGDKRFSPLDYGERLRGK
jgi:hypothetical protein